MTRLWTKVRTPLSQSLPGWVVARALVVGALLLAHYLVDQLHVHDAIARASVHSGLVSWDGAYYVEIAKHGYTSATRDALRFFPLIPLLARPFTWIGIPADAAVVFVSNVSALVAGVLLYILARRETGDARLATRAAWFLALAPAAFVLVMGYTEATTIALAIGFFLCLRSKRWWFAAGIGVLVGLSRPSGLLLALPALVEAARGLGDLPVKQYVARAAAVVSPGIGTLLFLAWVGNRFGDMWLPYSIQTESSRRGSFTNPIDTIDHALRGLFNGDAVGTGLHVPWLLLAAVLVVICFYRLPASYGVFAAVSIGSAVVSSNLDSFERYALSAFPLIIVVASLTSRPRTERAVLVLSGSAMTVYALLAFLHTYVP
jgi:Glycosyltransferase family 87